MTHGFRSTFGDVLRWLLRRVWEIGPGAVSEGWLRSPGGQDLVDFGPKTGRFLIENGRFLMILGRILIIGGFGGDFRVVESCEGLIRGG